MRRALALAAAMIAGAAALISTTAAGNAPAGTYEVRAIFDNAGFAVSGEEVRIAGAPVGQIVSLAVTKDNRAAVTLGIDNRDFTPFHADATCAIRPQSLIAERYVDCQPGTAARPPLHRIERGPGSGSYLLPVTQTSSPIDPDIVQDISQEPVRESLSVILDELGTGLAARGADLNAVIRRANPALGYTDRVFRILASQNRTLARLAADSDTILAPLAAARHSLADFVVKANTTATASAERQADIARSIQLLPSFLRRLRPLMAELGSLATQGTPVMASLNQAARGINRQFGNLIPFAAAARTALRKLGAAAQRSQTALVQSQPLARRLLSLGRAAQPSAGLLARLTHSLDATGAIEQLMRLLFYGTEATNGFDATGHYLRADAIFGSCTGYARAPVAGCSANFSKAGAATDIARAVVRAAAQPTAHAAIRETGAENLLRYLVGSGL